MSKVLVVGFDGATFDVVLPLVSQGRLPNVANLMQRGTWGPLRSAIPPITPTAWTTFFTGKNPGKHGVFDFHELDPDTYEMRPVRVDRHTEKSIWQLLTEAGKTSIVVDVPYTYPPQPLQGVQITGYGTPRTPGTVFTYPQDLADRVPADLRPEIRVALPRHTFDRSLAFVDEWTAIMDGRRRLLRHLMKEHDWDFFFVVFTITDFMAHVFWTFVEPAHPNYKRPEGSTYREAFFRAYEQADALLGELMTWAGPATTTLVMSDHGFGSIYPRQYLFRKLAEGGFVRFRSAPLLSRAGDRLIKATMQAYTSLPFLREWVKSMRPQRQKAVKMLLRRGGLIPSAGAVDFRKSPVLPSNSSLQMWINSQDRFTHGIVSLHEKHDLLDRLSRYLRALQDPVTQEPVVADVYQGSDVYQGPAVPRGPDLVIEYHNFYRPDAESRTVNPYLEGGHTGYGIFLAYGPGVRPTEVAGASLTDLAPTVLYLLGEPVPPDMDGRVIAEMFTKAYRTAHPVRYGTWPARLEEAPAGAESAYTPEQEAEIEDQLRRLGYIE
ncbi:MAG: hypothetical protein D6791_10260 [Chloroflexi bacterium]|nr:MAG: hypothetical protein D6791_10260 [Chloroflexota bacterium]